MCGENFLLKNRFIYCVCLVTIKGRQQEQLSEKAFVRTKEYANRQNEDYVGGAIC